MTECRALYDVFDADGDGLITNLDVKHFLEALGKSINSASV